MRNEDQTYFVLTCRNTPCVDWGATHRLEHCTRACRIYIHATRTSELPTRCAHRLLRRSACKCKSCTCNAHTRLSLARIGTIGQASDVRVTCSVAFVNTLGNTKWTVLTFGALHELNQVQDLATSGLCRLHGGIKGILGLLKTGHISFLHGFDGRLQSCSIVLCHGCLLSKITIIVLLHVLELVNKPGVVFFSPEPPYPTLYLLLGDALPCEIQHPPSCATEPQAQGRWA